MSKYIKLEEVIETVYQCRRAEANDEWIKRWLEPLNSLPTIDIVNCIECAYLGDDWWCYKHEFTPIPIEDYFCKDGENRNE